MVNITTMQSDIVNEFHQINSHLNIKNFNKNCDGYDDIRFHSLLPYLMLDFNFPYEQVLDEINQSQQWFYEHREDQSIGWKAMVIHGIGVDKTNVPEAYGIDPKSVTYDWTESSDSVPTLKKWMQEQPYFKDFERVRIMALEPGGYIEPHADNPWSKARLGPVNIAINNPVGCDFVMEGVGTLPFKPGLGAWLNLSYIHSVYNRSNETRYHIIVHGNKTNAFREYAQEVYNEYCNLTN